MDKEDIESHNRLITLINQITIAIRTSQMHSPNNIAVTSAIDKLVSTINDIIDSENTFKLNLRGEYFYFNDSRIRYALKYVLNFDYLVREFKNIELGSITINQKVATDDIAIFVSSYIKSSYSSDALESLEDLISGLPHIQVERLKKISDEKSRNVKKLVRKSYFNAVSHTRGIAQKMRSGEKVNLKGAKRVVTSMVNHLIEEEQFLLGMTAIKDYDEYTYHHSVNVSILSVALGHRLGLDRKRLIELGMVGLFHDIGKMSIPNEIINKPSCLSDDEWKVVRKHPVWGVMAILKIRTLDDLTINASIVAFEHHINIDLSGYPQTRNPVDIDMYSKIVSIADKYDAITSARVYSRVPTSPDKALSMLMETAGTEIDPLVFKFFINMVGIYPVGTLVMLDSKEIGMVYGNNQTFVSRPRVMIMTDSLGRRVGQYIVDLTEKNTNGQYLRTITKTMDVQKYNINPADILLAV
jgi:putative nucleotidyltransferase with HDIG domain